MAARRQRRRRGGSDHDDLWRWRRQRYLRFELVVVRLVIVIFVAAIKVDLLILPLATEPFARRVLEPYRVLEALHIDADFLGAADRVEQWLQLRERLVRFAVQPELTPYRAEGGEEARTEAGE